MGEYLEKAIESKNLKSNIKAGNGALTQNYKEKLSNLVLERLTWDEMTPYARELTREIIKFIKEHNKNIIR